MDRQSFYLFLLFLLILACTAWLSYYRIMIVKGYDVVQEQESIVNQLGI